MPNNGYWQGNPVNLDISRSKFKMPHRWTGTFQPGVLVPIFANSDILPGDTMKMDLSSVIRSITPIVPVMDDAYLDIEAYFVPHKLTLSRKYMSPDVNDSNHSFAAMMGAQDSLLNMPLPASGVTLPAMAVDTDPTRYTKGGLADSLGYPIGESGQGVYFVNPLEVLAYYSVWNEYFREPNLQVPVTYTITSSQYYPGIDLLQVTDTVNNDTSFELSALELMPVSRFHGYFGSALPWPQRNSTAVTVPLGDMAPVITGPNNTSEDFTESLKWSTLNDHLVVNGQHNLETAYNNSNGSFTEALEEYTGSGDYSHAVYPSNLYADLANASAISINQLRYLFATQKYYEALARGGNRLEEMSEALFGTRPHDAAADIPEYLGGKRIPLGMTQVNSTAGGTTAAVSQATLGSTGAFSLTNSSDYLFTKSFDTWGTVIVVACVRVKDSFSQGIARRHRRFKALDFYNPKFANIGEQPIYTEELLVHSDDETVISLSDLNGKPGAGHQDDPDKGNRYIFGYQEAWAEYRYMPDIVTGEIKPGSSMAYWTYANYFSPSANPTLKGFLNAKDQHSNFDRTLQVSSQTAGFTFIGQFLFDLDMVRPMPLYSIPGLIDHH